MKNKLLSIIAIALLLVIPKINFGQITLGAAASKFAIFTSSGAVSDNASAHSHVTGDVGSTSVSVTGFGNVNGVMHPGADTSTAACITALTATIGQITTSTNTYFPSGTMGSGVTLDSGVYSIAGSATLGGNLTLDAQGDPNAQFIIKIGNTFGASVNAKVLLVNGALACNVYWYINGAVGIASNVTMRGNIISNAAITLNVGDSLEGRLFTTAGAIGIDGVTIFTPIGCSSPYLTGPAFPNMGTTTCYTIFASIGALSNTVGTTSVIGDVGKNSNGSAITGWTASAVTGALHSTQDASTILCASDLSKLYDSLFAMPYDIELLYPVLFGHNLTLTPHVYLMNSGGANGPATLTDSVYLDAQGNANGIFVIKIIGGAFSTSTYSRVKLINGAQAKNVFWLLPAGAVSINNYSIFRGNIIVNTGAINLLNTGVVLDGRALTMNGAITTAGLVATMPPGCGLGSNITSQPINDTVCAGSPARFSVVVTGTGLTYQWRKGTVNLTNGGNISGATSDTLRINPANVSDTASNYNVIATGSSQHDTSNNAALIVNTAPIIISQPVNQSVCATSPARFSVVAKGTALTYQWRKGNVNLINGVNISGATSDTLRINSVSVSDTSSYYNVVITGTCAPIDTSNKVSLLINSNTIINTQPINKSTCVGNSVKFSVVAIGSGLTYQWRKGNVNLINGVNISGATTDTLTINPVSISDTSTKYYVIIFGTCSANDTSNYVSLSTSANTIINTQPINKSACIGNSVKFSVVATGSGLTYQWRKANANLINGGNISGATSDTLTINPVSISDTSSKYYVVIFGTCSVNDTSNYVSLSTSANTIINTQPINKSACVGNSVKFSVAATGSGLTYQWRKGNINLVNAGNISGATTDTLTINPANISDTSTKYYVIIFGACSPNDTSNYVSLSVNTTPIAIAGSNSPVCSGNPINLTAQTVAGATYAWTGPTAYSSAVQNPIINNSILANAGNYSLTVTMNGCNSIPSVAIVVVNNCDSSDLSVLKTVNNARPLVGTNVIFTIVATNNGPNTAKGIIVGDTLQSGYTFVSATTTKGTYDQTTGIWTIDTLYNGTSATLKITATVNTAGIYKNTATIRGIGVDKNPVNNISWVETFPSDFFIPQGFSPNGDGVNDLFVIRGIEMYPKNTFTVFNRWGDEVFTASPYQSNWDGTTTMGLRVGGNQLPVGTYFFILDLGDGSNIIKGTIYLNK